MRSSKITIGVFSNPLIGGGDIGETNLLAETLRGIHAVARNQGVQVVVISETPSAASFPPPAWEHVDGWIAVHVTDGAAELARTGVPMVLVNDLVEGAGCMAVLPDNRGGAHAAITHLIDHGHTRVAFMGVMAIADVRERYDGYRVALAEHHIPYDPDLVFDLARNQRHSLRVEQDSLRGIVQRLIEAGMPCTAIFPSNDNNARIVIEMAQAAGYHVPERLAVVGFDDIESAQYMDPPLTTIRQQLYENGVTAAQLLLARIAGQTGAPGITYVPTALIARRSCGCSVSQNAPLPEIPGLDTSFAWQEPLARELVRLIHRPLPLDPAVAPEFVWPGSTSVCRALAAVAQGRPLPAADVLARAWSEAAGLTTDLKNCLDVIGLLERSGARLAAAVSDRAASARLETFLRYARLELLRAYHARQKAATTRAEYLVRMTYDVSQALIGQAAGQAQRLGWLDQTSEIWGCLGLRDADSGSDSSRLTVVGSYCRGEGVDAPIGQSYSVAAFPPAELLPASTRGGENIVKLFPIRTPAREWGVLALCGPIEPRPNTPMLAMLLGGALERDSLLAALAAQQETLRVAYEHQLITENTRDLICMLDQAGRFLYASPSFQHLLGYAPATLSGAAIFDFIHPEDLGIVREQWAQIGLHGAMQATLRYRHAGGLWRWIELSAAAIARQDGPAVVIVGRDITERRHLETQLFDAQKLESIGRLAGGIAHDFNNLLTAINGYASLVLDMLPADHQARPDLDELQKVAWRAGSLTRQLLAFARKQVIEPRVLNLNNLIREVDKLLRRLIGEDIELVMRPTSDRSQVRADTGQIEQLLVNLAVNARDAMPRGGTLTIETANVVLDAVNEYSHAGVSAGPYVVLTMSDTGAGMDAETLQHVFEPFFTTKRPGKGTGLGLATCYGIVKQHGGHITIDSEPGGGTTVKIYLPRVEHAVAGLDRYSSVEAKPLPQGVETVLLVEDESAVRTLAARVLRAHGYTVLEAADGNEALRVAQKYAGLIDLVLTDVVMPQMSGQALVEHLRVVRPDIKVLFMSGYAEDMIVHHGKLDPGISLLQKPFSPAALVHKVRDILNARNQMTDNRMSR
jgi:PAS domain S-box-containing protein